MSAAPFVAEVLAFGPLNSSPGAPRRAVVAWSDGSVGEALRWFADELLFCEGDLIGKTAVELRSLLGARDREHLSGEPGSDA